MADIVYITPFFAVASQLGASDFGLLAAMGFKSVINNRPDEEEGLPIRSGDAAELARKHGLDYTYLPLTHHELLDDETIDAQAAALASLPGPVLAYCRTGNRSSIVWALAAARQGSVKEILKSLADVGLDIDFLEPELTEQSERAPRVAADTASAELAL